MTNNTILETSTNSFSGKKNITVSRTTYDRLVKIGRFSDRTFDHLITRLLDERESKGPRAKTRRGSLEMTKSEKKDTFENIYEQEISAEMLLRGNARTEEIIDQLRKKNNESLGDEGN